MKKYCTKCGQPFDSVGREVICPSCKAAAAEETRRAAVLKAKRASWAGESVPVRISGRASTVIREYGAAHDLPFTAALDALLKASSYVKSLGTAWETIAPYKSRRRDKHATQETPQDKPDAPDKAQDKPQDKQDKPAAKASASKAKESKEVKTVKVAGKAASKASKASK